MDVLGELPDRERRRLALVAIRVGEERVEPGGGPAEPVGVARLEGVLERYDIPDRATQRELMTSLALLDFLDGR